MTDPTPDLPAHLTPNLTERGFRYLPPLPNRYGGPEDISVRTSSNAGYAGLWLDVTAMNVAGTPVEVAANLDAATAWRLAEQLAFLVATHYHGDQRPHPEETLLSLRLPGETETPEAKAPEAESGADFVEFVENDDDSSGNDLHFYIRCRGNEKALRQLAELVRLDEEYDDEAVSFGARYSAREVLDLMVDNPHDENRDVQRHTVLTGTLANLPDSLGDLLGGHLPDFVKWGQS